MYHGRDLGRLREEERGIQTVCMTCRRKPGKVSQLEMIIAEWKSKTKNEKCLNKNVCINIFLMRMNYTEHYIRKHDI